MSKSWLGWVAVAGLIGPLTLVACGSDEDEGGASGQAGAAGSAGTSATGGLGGTGAASGSGANAGSAGTAATGGTAGNTGGTGGLTGAPLGQECADDADCQTGFCLTPHADDFRSGGPANGYCTVDCTDFANDASLPNPCSDFGADSLCHVTQGTTTVATKAYCLKGCTEGPPIDWSSVELDELNPNKCFGRRDVMCQQLTDGYGNPLGTPVCMPHCQRDAHCADAYRMCDPRFKVCRDEQHLTTGRDIGAACGDYRIDETVSEDPCAGLCVVLRKDSAYSSTDEQNRAPFCSETCIVNTFDSCGFNRSFASSSPAICLLAPVEAGIGDLGFCLQMCDVDTDCLAHGDKYANVSCNTENASGLGRGVCDYAYGFWEGGGGAAGAAGSAGAGGVAGSAGASGAAGAAGAGGVAGSAGASGAAGAAGAGGVAGSAGSAGSAGGT